MLIELTTKCSMGCTHCMSSCTPNGVDMNPQVLMDTLEFVKREGIGPVVFSGGEMFENQYIRELLDIISDYYAPWVPLSITTNGRVLSSNMELYDYFRKFIEKFKKGRVIIQVTDDPRFYPTKLDEKQRYRLSKLGAIIEGVPGDGRKCLYPQGRALENFDESWWNTKGPKCVNVRINSILRPDMTFGNLCRALFYGGHMCTPQISPTGDIKLGESALCPSVATIYQTDNEIMDSIRNFICTGCKVSLNVLKDTDEGIYMLLNEYSTYRNIISSIIGNPYIVDTD